MHCVCGQQFHADPAHAGRSIRCRCGRTVLIPKATGPTTPRSQRSRTRLRLPRFPWPTLRVPRRVLLVLTLLTWGYLAATLSAAAILWILGDRWWLATVFLFGPRWPLLLPALPLALGAALLRPRLLVPTTVAALIAIGPIMGFNLGWRGWFQRAGARELRLITFNVDAVANPRLGTVPIGLARYEADVVAFQECGYALTASELWPPGWSLVSKGDICLMSRYPVINTKVEDRVLTAEQGGTGTVVLFRLLMDRDTLELAVVHLETPRKGLEPLRASGDVSSLTLNTMVRDAGSSKSSRWIADQLREPLVVGDFNLPVESRIFREHWSSCPDAFTVAGHGFGWTRVLKRFSARIDHVLTCGSWRTLHIEVGPDLGSDHRPLIVDLARRR